MIIRILASVLLGIGLAACGKGGIGNPFGSEDPFAGMPDEIRNPQTEGDRDRKPQAPSDLREEDFQFSTDQADYKFREGIPGEVKMTAKIARANFNAEIKVGNPVEFPGATFDPLTGTFEWTPATGVVTDPTQPLLKRMRVEISAIDSNGRFVRSKEFFVAIYVYAAVIRVPAQFSTPNELVEQ